MIPVPVFSASYRVVGVLLATHDAACYLHGLDLADVEHDRIDVDVTIPAGDARSAASDAAWCAAQDYTTWRWESAPTVEEVTA